MMVYRIVNLKYKEDAFSGIGAEKVGGRWNEKGTRAVYCSENISLALLEYYIHSENVTYLPGKIGVAKIEFPDEFEIQELKELPKRWNQYPYSSKTASVFSEFIKNQNGFALRVPSSIVPLESNIILNPLFADFGKVRIVELIELALDERLRKER